MMTPEQREGFEMAIKCLEEEKKEKIIACGEPSAPKGIQCTVFLIHAENVLRHHLHQDSYTGPRDRRCSDCITSQTSNDDLIPK